MGLLEWLGSDDDNVVVKHLKSKAVSREEIAVTVGMIKKGIAPDSDGYPNEIALFLRKPKKDR